MATVSLTGNDTLILDTRIFKDMGDGDVCNIDFSNNLVEGKVGKNGNVIYAMNASGKNAVATLRVLRGSPDDKWLNSRMMEYINDPASFVTIEGEFIKRSGDGKGNVTSDIYQLSGGAVQKIPGTKENMDGETEQSLAIYTLFFANGGRVQG